MKSTGSTIDSFVESSFGLPYNRSMPEENTEIEKKKLEVIAKKKNMTEEFSLKALVMGVFSLKIRMLLEKAIPKSIHIVAIFATIFFPRTDEVTKYLC